MLLEDWLDAGPRRVEGEVRRRLSELAARGSLRLADPQVATAHFIAVTQAELLLQPYAGGPAPTPERLHEIVAAGVVAFLDGYGTAARR